MLPSTTADRRNPAAPAKGLSRFEMSYVLLEPFLPPLHAQLRARLVRFAKSRQNAQILDVGGRKSHYTIGVPGHITITDLERSTQQQTDLNLGVTSDMIRQTYLRRTNVARILVDDMTQSALPDASFDCVVAVEVLEHVERDLAFVQHVHRVLRPGGVFLMSTPNGDWVKNENPDHKRHYRRSELSGLLSSCFETVSVEYAIHGGKLRTLGLRPWSVRRPLQTAVSMLSNLGNRFQSSRESLKQQAEGPRHLIASAIKSST